MGRMTSIYQFNRKQPVEKGYTMVPDEHMKLKLLPAIATVREGWWMERNLNIKRGFPLSLEYYRRNLQIYLCNVLHAIESDIALSI